MSKGTTKMHEMILTGVGHKAHAYKKIHKREKRPPLDERAYILGVGHEKRTLYIGNGKRFTHF